MNEDIKKLYTQSLPSFRSGIFYNTYAYPTKIAPESVAVYIATHTKPGDLVLDAFGGSGSTGLAALMCEHPTNDMFRLADKLGAKPVWGARNASIYEISTYGSFAARVMTNPPTADEFADAAYDLLERVSSQVGAYYNAIDPEGHVGRIRYVVWSSVFVCPKCGKEFSFLEGMVKRGPIRIDSHGRCPHCGSDVSVSECEYSEETVWDQLLCENITRRKRIPALVYGETDGQNWRRLAIGDDLQRIATIDEAGYPEYERPKEIKWGELHRAGYHKGITHLHHFYTRRNFLVISSLWETAERYEPALRDALRLLILSYNETHSTLMTRVVAKSNSPDFVLTGAQSGVLYISNLPVEKNILKGLKRKIAPFARAFRYVNSCSGTVDVHNSSCTSMAEGNGSVSYVFTDPPFGGFIPYAEVNQINELWLEDVTNREDEAIVSPSQGKNVVAYGDLLERSFREIRRVLQDDGLATLVFHSSKADVWQALARALRESGLYVEATSHLDKTQESFKQVVSSASVKNDSLILLSKTGRRVQGPEEASLRENFKPTTDDPRLAYAEYVNFCLENRIPVDLDAKEAYERYAAGDQTK